MPNTFNNHLRQVFLLGLIIMLGIMLITQLYLLLPGLLGGVTLFILSRKWYYSLTIKKKWSKGLTALLFMIASLIVIAIPVYFSIRLISPKISSLVNSQQEVVKGLEIFSNKIERYTHQQLFSASNAQSIARKVSSYIPSFLNSTATLLTNLVMMFFILYYLLYSGKEIEKYLDQIIPL
ncbi:MAG: AI-2E family transporter, partial [Ferruginibacter sp.]